MEVTEWAIICSPVSGKKEGRHVVEHTLLPAWKKHCANLPVKVFYTESSGHAVELARQNAKSNRGIIGNKLDQT